MYGRPHGSKKNLSTGAAHSRVLTCIRPLLRRVSCRRPVWEFADQIQNNLARSRRSSMIWFFRSRLCDRCAIPSVRPSYAVDSLAISPALCGSRDRSSINSTMGEQRPNYPRHFVGQRHSNQHWRLAAQHPIEPRPRRRASASRPCSNSASANNQQASQGSFAHSRCSAQTLLAS